MFIVSLTYRVDLDEVDRLLAEHVDFLDRQFAAGHFVLSGRKVPRTGGVILAVGVDRTTLDAILADDPFHREGVATYDVVELQPTKAAPGLEHLLAG